MNTVNAGVNAVMRVVAVPVDNSGISVEMEGLDAESCEQIFALSAYATGGVTELKGFVTKLGHARSAFKRITRTALDPMPPGEPAETEMPAS